RRPPAPGRVPRAPVADASASGPSRRPRREAHAHLFPPPLPAEEERGSQWELSGQDRHGLPGGLPGCGANEEWSMNEPERSRAIHFTEADAAIPGPGGERSIAFLQRGSLEVKLSRPLPPNR